MTFTTAAWEEIAPIRARIASLPFVVELADGSLPRQTFVHYLAQDAHYLSDYARALALAAATADTSDETLFWSNSSRDAIAVERQLHLSHVAAPQDYPASPTTTGYTSYLLGRGAVGGYPVLAAALLPCFWLYADIGATLLSSAGNLDGHPYADWIGTYAHPDFDAATARARQIVDEVAQRVNASTRERMRQAFTTCSRYEWMFFDAAYRRETWPV